jgi:hypothetical protein
MSFHMRKLPLLAGDSKEMPGADRRRADQKSSPAPSTLRRSLKFWPAALISILLWAAILRLILWFIH